ncbi:MAG: MJ0042-type zinc finger domain-containing protein [Pseudomonadota bacterium]
MILTCPECDTSYFVDDLRIPRLGRMVKCTNCGHRWRAFQDRDLPESEAPDDDLVFETPAEPPPPAEDLAVVAAPAAKPKPPPKKNTPLAAVIAAGVGVGLAVILAGAILAREQVARLVPATAPVFAAIGLPVNTIGLVIEGVASKETFQGGRPVLAVTGAVRSVVKEPTDAPPIRISLLDKDGKPLASLLAEPLNGRVPPGAKRYFAVSLNDPPAGAHDLEVAFDPAARHAAPAAKAGHGEAPAAAEGHAPAGHAPAPVEAQPLPADSPDALKSHEQH